jgi:Fe2+ or Zn2+ uptake regulation protein
VPIPDGPSEYGVNEPTHHHALCGKCTNLVPIPADELDQLIYLATSLAHFQSPRTGALTLHGTCVDCAP